MEQKPYNNDILNELRELESPLADLRPSTRQPELPEGYFSSLEASILSRTVDSVAQPKGRIITLSATRYMSAIAAGLCILVASIWMMRQEPSISTDLYVDPFEYYDMEEVATEEMVEFSDDYIDGILNEIDENDIAEYLSDNINEMDISSFYNDINNEN